MIGSLQFGLGVCNQICRPRVRFWSETSPKNADWPKGFFVSGSFIRNLQSEAILQHTKRKINELIYHETYGLVFSLQSSAGQQGNSTCVATSSSAYYTSTDMLTSLHGGSTNSVSGSTAYSQSESGYPTNSQSDGSYQQTGPYLSTQISHEARSVEGSDHTTSSSALSRKYMYVSMCVRVSVCQSTDNTYRKYLTMNYFRITRHFLTTKKYKHTGTSNVKFWEY